MKTNKQWYPYEQFGSYFKLEDGTLMQCPMHTDGSRENNPCEVTDFSNLDGLIEDLEKKQ